VTPDISEFFLFMGALVCFAAIVVIINKAKKPKEE
jgi:hypothetical protein